MVAKLYSFIPNVNPPQVQAPPKSKPSMFKTSHFVGTCIREWCVARAYLQCTTTTTQSMTTHQSLSYSSTTTIYKMFTQSINVSQSESTTTALGMASVILAALGAAVLLMAQTTKPTADQNTMIAPSVIPSMRVVPAMPGLVPRRGPIADAPQNPMVLNAATPAASGDPGAVMYLDAANFNDVIAGDIPVLIDYYATWCGPCRLMDPYVAELSTTYEGRVKVYKMDCGEHAAKCGELGIKMLPTFQMYKSGKMIGEMFGTKKDKLEQIISKALIA